MRWTKYKSGKTSAGENNVGELNHPVSASPAGSLRPVMRLAKFGHIRQIDWATTGVKKVSESKGPCDSEGCSQDVTEKPQNKGAKGTARCLYERDAECVGVIKACMSHSVGASNENCCGQCCSTLSIEKGTVTGHAKNIPKHRRLNSGMRARVCVCVCVCVYV